MVIASITLIVGLLAGTGLVWLLSRAQLEQSRAAAGQILDGVDQDLGQLEERANQEAEEQRRELERESEDELIAERKELDDYAAELNDRDEVMAAREADAVELQEEVEAKETTVKQQKQDAKRFEQKRHDARDMQGVQLEERSGKTRDQILEQIVTERV